MLARHESATVTRRVSICRSKPPSLLSILGSRVRRTAGRNPQSHGAIGDACSNRTQMAGIASRLMTAPFGAT